MSGDIDLGGVRIGLTMDLSEWQKGAQVSVKSVDQLAKKVDEALKQVDKTVATGAAAISKSLGGIEITSASNAFQDLSKAAKGLDLSGVRTFTQGAAKEFAAVDGAAQALASSVSQSLTGIKLAPAVAQFNSIGQALGGLKADAAQTFADKVNRSAQGINLAPTFKQFGQLQATIGKLPADKSIPTWADLARQKLQGLEMGANVFASKTMAAFRSINLNWVGTAFNTMGDSVKKAMAESSAAIKQFEADTKKTRAQLANIGATLGLGSAAITGALTVAGQRYLATDKSLHSVNSIAHLTRREFDGLSDSLTRFAVTGRTGQTTKQLADGLYDIQSSGFEGKDGLEILKDAAVGAKAGMTDASVVSGVLTQSLNGMGVGAESSRKYLDVMFKTVDKGVITFDQLARELGEVTAIGKSSRVSFEEMNAAIAVLTQRGSRPQKAITGLRQLIVQLAAPTEEAAKKLDLLGVKAGDKALQQKGLLGVVQDLVQKTGGNKELLRPILGDVEALDAALKLVANDGGALFNTRIKEMESAAGSTGRAFREMLGADASPFEEIAINLGVLAEGVGKGVVTMIRPVTEFIRDLTEKLALLPRSSQATLGIMAAMGAAAMAAVAGFVALAPAIAAIPAAWSAVGSAGTLVLGILGKIGAAAAGMATGPVAALAGATALLAVAWVKDWGGVRELVADVGSSIVQKLSAVVAFLREDFLPGAVEVATAIGVAWKEGLWPILQWVGDNIAGGFVAVIRRALIILGAAFDVLVNSVKVAVAAIKAVLETLGRIISTAITTAALILTGHWQEAWDTFIQSAQNALPRLKEILGQMVSEVEGSVGSMARTLKNGFQEFLTGSRDQDVLGTQGTISGRVATAFLSSFNPSAKIEQMTKAAKSIGAGATKRLAPFLASMAAPSPQMTGLDPEGAMERYLRAAADQKAAKAKARSKKAPPLTRAQMTSAIFAKADVRGASLDGLDDKTLAATFRLVENAAANKLMLQINSAYRSNSKTFHGAGMAVDVDIPSLSEKMAPEAIKRLAKGTGFRSGINEFLPEALAKTGGSGAHMHLTTGVENGGVPGTFMLDGKVQKGTHDVMAGLAQYKEKLVQFATDVSNFVSLPVSQFDKQRQEIGASLLKMEKQARELGIPQEALDQARQAAKTRLAEVDTEEKAATKKTLAELTQLKFEAEGKMGEAARARIEQESADELERLRMLQREYPALAKQIESAMESVRKSSRDKIGEQSALDEFARYQGNASTQAQMRSLGVSNLGDVRNQLSRAGLGQAVTDHFSDDAGLGSEEQLRRMQQALQMLQTVRDTEAQISQERMKGIEFEFQMGKLSRDQRLAAYAEDLNSYTANDDLKRQKMMEYAEMYAEDLANKLEMQGEFNADTLDQLADALESSADLTTAKMAELGAIRNLQMQQEMQETQYRMQLLGGLESTFSSFFQGVLTGNQTLSQGLQGIWKSISSMILGELAKWIAKALLFRVIMGAIGSIFGLGGGAGLISGGGMSEFAGIGLGHSGGTVGQGWITPGSMPAPYFHSGGWVGGNLRSDETMAVLQTGEYVMSRQQVAAAKRGAGGRDRDASRELPPMQFNSTNYIASGLDADRVGSRMGRQARRAAQGLV